MESIELITKELNSRLKDYELEGVEIVEEDAMLVQNYMANGSSLDEAIHIVLNGICETLGS